jgi:hypothetical protein
VIISVNQTRVPIVFARTIPQTTPTVTRTPGNLSLGSLKDVSVSPNVQEGDGIFYSATLNKFVSSQANSNVISVLDGGTY